jgi:hypothetical protein
MSGIAAGIVIGGKVDFQRFTADGTWNKPAGVTQVYMEVIGGGGSGGGGRGGSNNSGDDGGGGAGGAFVRSFYPAESLPTTLDVVVGEEVVGGAGASSGTAPSGNVGELSKVTDTTPSPDKIILQAFGGGGGGGAVFNDGADGGGGGGTGSGGSVGAYNSAGDGGNPIIQGMTKGDILGGGGAVGSQFGRSGEPDSGNAEFGGAGGGGRSSYGGSSIFGAGGGGGQDGGAWSSYSRGGTTGAGSAFQVGNPGISRSYGCGDGGTAGRGPHVGLNPSSPGKVGGNGGEPGGGGGGGSGAYSNTGAQGGLGARGEVRIWSW